MFRRLGRSVIESKALDLREVNSWANDLLRTLYFPSHFSAQQGALQTIDVDGLGQTGSCSEFKGSDVCLTAGVAREYHNDGRWRAGFDDPDYVDAAVAAQPENVHCLGKVEG